MKKISKTLLCLLGILTINNVKAETIHIKECEYTKEYIAWLELSDKEKENTYMPTMCKNDSKDKFYFVGGIDGVSVSDSKFSLVDHNLSTSVKNQEDTMACWAYATSASIESNLLVNNLGEYDLSEGHIELATQNTYDYGRTTFNRAKNAGGNYYVSASYLMNNWGPVKEEYLPFTTYQNVYNNKETIEADVIVNNPKELDINSIVYLGNSGSCNSATISDIKEYLITNGAMAAKTYYRNGEDGSFNKYYYYDGNSYTNYDGETIEANQSVNHAVTIVGWDDTISKDKFSKLGTPTNDGAWIVKNSYGTKLELSELAEYKENMFNANEEYFKENGINSASEISNEFIIAYLSNLAKVEENQVIIENDKIYITIGDNGYQYISYDDIYICNGVAGFLM